MTETAKHIVAFRGLFPIFPDSLNLNYSTVALQLANEQRSAYGLRYNDFTRYRYDFIVNWTTINYAEIKIQKTLCQSYTSSEVNFEDHSWQRKGFQKTTADQRSGSWGWTVGDALFLHPVHN